jgi:hypothetical protein
MSMVVEVRDLSFGVRDADAAPGSAVDKILPQRLPPPSVGTDAYTGNGFNPNPQVRCGVPALTRSAQAPEPERTSALEHYASPQARHPI